MGERGGVNEVLTRPHTGLDAHSKRQECPYMASYSTNLPKWSVYGFEFTNQKAGFVFPLHTVS